MPLAVGLNDGLGLSEVRVLVPERVELLGTLAKILTDILIIMSPTKYFEIKKKDVSHPDKKN